ncbi:hypothetical protein SAMN05421806_106210 [Streptomyces indicus]|uniref:Uncharacterized protein n=1 Tax=Streptomyces indicus TaxID=417292 RepID=A0A1G9AXR2_9ACTN|nr:hypothetical protein SAMN05421806_106210 [Streptomyces indicus]
MASQPAGHKNGDDDKRERWYKRFRWLGPIYTLYRIVRDHL